MHFLWIKGIAQLHVANIVQDADTQFVFAVKKIKLLQILQKVAAIIHLHLSNFIFKCKLPLNNTILKLAIHLGSVFFVHICGWNSSLRLQSAWDSIICIKLFFCQLFVMWLAVLFLGYTVEWFPTAENPSFCRFWCCCRSICIVNKARFQAWITHILVRKCLCLF